MSADLEVVQYTEFPVERSGFPHRVIPAVVGGVFAGLLLVGLGCTPFFQPQSQKPAAEQGTIVQGKAGAFSLKPQSSDSMPIDGNPTGALVAAAPHYTTPSPVAASSSSRGGIVSADTSKHRFSVVCDPQHGTEPANTPRPESASLQGIMAGSKKAALLDGVLYREGDAFGSGRCPWTVAMIDARSVRIEKSFGDRTAGVTIHWQNDKPVASAPSASPPPRPRAMTSVSASPRSR